MNEMMSYIFGTLQKNEASLSKLTKVVNKQASKLGLLTVVGVGYIYLAEYRYSLACVFARFDRTCLFQRQLP